MAVAIREGKSKKKIAPSVVRMLKLSKESLLKIARTKHAGLPERVKKTERVKSNRKKLT